MPDEISPQETFRVDRLCVFALSIEWILFGSCHFVFVGPTCAELPHWFPFQVFTVIFTGVVEVATGILILLPRTRRLAAVSSLVLLAVFLLPIFNMLAADTAVPGSSFFRNFVRVLLVPNHILLALCAIHLYRRHESSPNDAAHLLEGMFGRRAIRARRHGALVVATIMFFANSAGFLVILGAPWSQTTAKLWAMMCLAVGAAGGFLFGVPKTNARATRLAGLRPNSNIEVISDWLTKIIVGVGLVEFRKIDHSLDGLATQLGQALMTNPTAQIQSSATAFAKALVVYFTTAGAIQGYLLTRLYLAGEFELGSSKPPASHQQPGR